MANDTRPGPAVIGTIDMDAVLKTYEKYKAQMEAMKVDMLARLSDIRAGDLFPPPHHPQSNERGNDQRREPQP